MKKVLKHFLRKEGNEMALIEVVNVVKITNHLVRDTDLKLVWQFGRKMKVWTIMWSLKQLHEAFKLQVECLIFKRCQIFGKTVDSRATLSKGSKHIQLRDDIFLKESRTRGFSEIWMTIMSMHYYLSVILGTLFLLRNNRLPRGTNWKTGPLFLGANHLAESWQWVISAILKNAALAVSKYYPLLTNAPIDLQSYSPIVCDSHVKAMYGKWFTRAQTHNQTERRMVIGAQQWKL